VLTAFPWTCCTFTKVLGKNLCGRRRTPPSLAAPNRLTGLTVAVRRNQNIGGIIIDTSLLSLRHCERNIALLFGVFSSRAGGGAPHSRIETDRSVSRPTKIEPYSTSASGRAGRRQPQEVTLALRASSTLSPERRAKYRCSYGGARESQSGEQIEIRVTGCCLPTKNELA